MSLSTFRCGQVETSFFWQGEYAERR